MTADAALALLYGLVQVTLYVAGPLLAASLIGGLFVGVLQTATQINEASVGYVVKASCVLLTMLLFGPVMVEKVTSYARTSIEGIAQVVR